MSSGVAPATSIVDPARRSVGFPTGATPFSSMTGNQSRTSMYHASSGNVHSTCCPGWTNLCHDSGEEQECLGGANILVPIATRLAVWLSKARSLCQLTIYIPAIGDPHITVQDRQITIILTLQSCCSWPKLRDSCYARSN